MALAASRCMYVWNHSSRAGKGTSQPLLTRVEGDNTVIGHTISLKERQGTAMLGKVSTAGNNLLAGLHAPCKVTYLVREPNPVVLCSPHKLFVSVRYFLLE